MAQINVDNWKADLKEVLCARVCSCLNSSQIDAKLTTMDTDWAAMAAGEKTSCVDWVAERNALGGKTVIKLAYDGSESPYFPKKMRIKAALLDDIAARYTS